MIMSDYSAAASGIGYIQQQVYYSLYLILEQYEPSISIRIEGRDDIELLEKNKLRELIQIKHHENQNVSLSNRSIDFWKTIGIWSDHVKKNWITVPDTHLILCTTAKVSDESIPSLLRAASKSDRHRACQQLRDEAISCKLTKDALQKLSEKNIPTQLLEKLTSFENRKFSSKEEFWETFKKEIKSIKGIDKYEQLILDSTKANRELQKAFDLFMNLSVEQQNNLVEAIQILDSSDNIIDTHKKLENTLHGIGLEYRHEALNELLGWWLEIVVEHLYNNSQETISKEKVEHYISFIARKFSINLPEDYELPPDFDSRLKENERFVRQLKVINARDELRKIAIEYHHRAFHQRTKWRNEGRIGFKELEEYEQELIHWWEESRCDLIDRFEDEYNCKFNELNEESLKKFGKELYAEIRKNNQKTAPHISIKRDYMVQGSYHILADELSEKENIPRVYWHPKFHEQDSETLS